MAQKVVLFAGLIFILLLAGTVAEDISIYLNLKSALLVLGGALISVLLAFPIAVFKGLYHSLQRVFRNETPDAQQIIEEIENMARVRRLYGPRELSAVADQCQNPFLRKGIDLVVDDYDRYEIHNIMEREFELYFSRRHSQANILNTLGKLTPAFGFVGTIIGLISVLNTLEAPSEIGKGMSLALLTTFYGLVFANFLFLPLARKLVEHSQAESLMLSLILEGVMDIAEGKNPRAISYRLKSYLGVGMSDNLLEGPRTKMTAKKNVKPGKLSRLMPRGFVGNQNA